MGRSLKSLRRKLKGRHMAKVKMERRRLQQLAALLAAQEESVEVKQENLSSPENQGMSVEGSEEHSSLCVLCCYSFVTSKRDWDVERETLDKFFRSSEFFSGCSSLSSAEELFALEGVAICPECLAEVTLAVGRRERVAEVETQVRQLQLQILTLMTQLKGRVDAYLETWAKLQDKISCSDEACLKARLGDVEKGRSAKRRVLTFRREIVSGGQRLRGFRNGLSVKWTTSHDASDPESDPEAPPQDVKIKEEPTSDAEQENNVRFEADVTVSEAPDDPDDHDPKLPVSKVKTRVSSKSIGPRVPCPHCRKLFVRRTLSFHIKFRCPQQPRPPVVFHRCLQCNLTFRGSVKFARHNTTVHGIKSLTNKRQPPNPESWPYTCGECGLQCRGSVTLQRHVETVHLGKPPPKPHECAACGRSFPFLHTLQRHKCHVPDPKPKPRRDCPDTNRLKILFKPWLECRPKPDKEENAMVQCQDCGKLLSTKMTLYTHSQSFCPKRAKETHVCETCGVVRTSQFALQRHRRRVHTADPNGGTFSCDLCGKTGFRNRGNLQIHRKRHQDSAKRPWVCDKCGGDFNCSSHLRRHEKRCDGSKKPRKPRWTNMVQPISSSTPTENPETQT